ncbi:ligase-associated DNA damage response exonuclease [Arenibacterium sp. CAU 1754]
MSHAAVLTFTPNGIYCPAGDFHIDPWRPVDRALITHGHADHARPGHHRYLCTTPAAPVVRQRLGDITLETVEYGESRKIGGATVSFLPAGHVPGSAQIRVEVGGQVWVASGDYKLESDGVSEPFETVPCHSFITESTFGLPVFRWQSQQEVAREINDWWAQCQSDGRTAILGAYALGKAQRLLHMLDASRGPILTHGAVENVTQTLRAQGLTLPDTVQVTPDLDLKAHSGALVMAPPSALGSSWARRFGPVSTGFASGWMQMRGVRRRRSVDRGFVMSDHADWTGLNHAIKETGAENIYVTHGYTEVFSRWLNDNGWNARIVPTEFGVDEDDQ